MSVAKKANMVPIQMELEGKDACLVFPDADLRLAASAVAKGGFSYSGQRCTAVKLVLAFEDIADALVKAVCEKIEALRVGRPEDNADITALVSKASADYVQGLVEDAVKKGAVLKQPWRREDNLVWPVLVDRVTSEMRLAWRTFGPVVPVVRVNGESERCGSSRASTVCRGACSRKTWTTRSRRRPDGNRDGADQRPAGAQAGPSRSRACATQGSGRRASSTASTP